MNPIFFCSDVATIVRIIEYVTKAWIVQSLVWASEKLRTKQNGLLRPTFVDYIHSYTYGLYFGLRAMRKDTTLL